MLVSQCARSPVPDRAARESSPDMSTKSLLILRAIAVGGSAALALGVSAGVAAAQTGSLESGFGLDIDSVLSPAGELLPDPGSLDEAVSGANAGSAAGSPDIRVEKQHALPPPSGSDSSGGGSGGATAAGGTGTGSGAAGSGSAGGGVTGAGSLDPIQPGLGAGVATGPSSPTPGVLGSGSGDLDRTGADANTPPGAALTALITMAGGHGEDGSGPAELPPLPPLR